MIASLLPAPWPASSADRRAPGATQARRAQARPAASPCTTRACGCTACRRGSSCRAATWSRQVWGGAAQFPLLFSSYLDLTHALHLDCAGRRQRGRLHLRGKGERSTPGPRHVSRCQLLPAAHHAAASPNRRPAVQGRAGGAQAEARRGGGRGFCQLRRAGRVGLAGRLSTACSRLARLVARAWPAASCNRVGARAAGKNSNTSQFYVTLGPAPQCDQKHVVVGRVVEGLEVLKQIGGWVQGLQGARRRQRASWTTRALRWPRCCRGAGGQP